MTKTRYRNLILFYQLSALVAVERDIISIKFQTNLLYFTATCFFL